MEGAAERVRAIADLVAAQDRLVKAVQERNKAIDHALSVGVSARTIGLRIGRSYTTVMRNHNERQHHD